MLDRASQLFDLLAELGRSAHGPFRSAQQATHAIGVPQPERFRQFTQGGNRQTPS